MSYELLNNFQFFIFYWFILQIPKKVVSLQQHASPASRQNSALRGSLLFL